MKQSDYVRCGSEIMSKNEQPYIFISYAHKDFELISPFISALKEKYAVWYDEGIRYGIEWEEEIAEKLGCRIRMYEGQGHAVYEEARDFNRAVYDFLKS